MSAVGSEDARLRTFISRILRLKSDQDDIGTDIQEVYAELKSEGYDKTAVGQVVSIIRKRLKDPGKYEEMSTVVRMYLDAFDGTEIATHAHAPDVEAFDPHTGEVLGDAPAPAPQPAQITQAVRPAPYRIGRREPAQAAHVAPAEPQHELIADAVKRQANARALLGQLGQSAEAAE